MKKIYNTAIVGGGAAGLMSAVELLRDENAIKGEDVVILERNDRVGKKLIATGNGQGNLTNISLSNENYYGDKEFINSFIEHVTHINIRAYLEKLGIPLYTGKDGKMYPLSRQASAVLDIIRLNLIKNGVEERIESEVTKINKIDGVFNISTTSGQVVAKNVIFAAGGAAGKQFGTDGSAYKILEDLGHRKTPVYPSLVQLKTDTGLIRSLKGLKEVAKVTAIVGGREVKSVIGDLLFTEFGVSGAAIFELSAVVTDKKDVRLKIEFLPDLTENEIVNIISKRQELGYFDKTDLLIGLINKRVGQAVMKVAKECSAKALARSLKNFTLDVTGNLGFNYAQVTKGGILTDDIDKKTMESKLINNLFVVGEILNLDGDCGGYNLTFAFTSGILAAKAIKNRGIR